MTQAGREGWSLLNNLLELMDNVRESTRPYRECICVPCLQMILVKTNGSKW